MYIDDINNHWKNTNIFENLGLDEIHPDVTVVTEKGDLKKADVQVLRLRVLEEIDISKTFISAGREIKVLKVDYLSEYKFLPLIKQIGRLKLDENANPSVYWQTSEVLTNNISNAPLVDTSLFYLDTCILIISLGS